MSNLLIRNVRPNGGEATDILVRDGKIRHAGVSNCDVGEMQALAAHGPVETDQPAYSMFRRSVEDDVLPYTD